MLKQRVALFFLVVLIFAISMQLWQGHSITPRVSVVYAASQTYNTTTTWTVPAGVTQVTVEARGGGAGGSKNGSATARPGGGGGGGAYAKGTVSVTPGNQYTVTVAAAVVAETAGNPSSFIGNNAEKVEAVGGSTTTTRTGGAGGAASASTGNIATYSGGDGGTATNTNGHGGAGGGEGAGSTGNGNPGQTNSTSFGGVGGSGTDGGDGGSGGGNTGTGFNGAVPGGGGGGSGGNADLGGGGAAGRVILTYNLPPTFTVNPSDSPDPVNAGSSVTFTATSTDSDNNSWYLAVCKTNEINPGSPPTCATNQTYCVSNSAVASGSQNSCSWTSTGSGDQSWYAFACDNASSGAACSSANTTNSPLNVIGVTISVSLNTDGTIAYGTMSPGQTKNTITLSDTQQIINDGGGNQDINIKTSTATGGTGWSLGGSAGNNVFKHEFSKNAGGNWTTFSAADSYQLLSSSLGVGQTVNLDFQLTVPSSGSDNVQKSITITIQAVEAGGG